MFCSFFGIVCFFVFFSVSATFFLVLCESSRCWREGTTAGKQTESSNLATSFYCFLFFFRNGLDSLSHPYENKNDNNNRWRWGVLHFEQEEQTRSQFFGKQTLDTITGRFMPEYPAWRRWMTYALTMPVMVGFTGAVLALMFMVSFFFLSSRNLWIITFG